MYLLGHVCDGSRIRLQVSVSRNTIFFHFPRLSIFFRGEIWFYVSSVNIEVGITVSRAIISVVSHKYIFLEHFKKMYFLIRLQVSVSTDTNFFIFLNYQYFRGQI